MASEQNTVLVGWRLARRQQLLEAIDYNAQVFARRATAIRQLDRTWSAQSWPTEGHPTRGCQLATKSVSWPLLADGTAVR